jgi:hypothetical protein
MPIARRASGIVETFIHLSSYLVEVIDFKTTNALKLERVRSQDIVYTVTIDKCKWYENYKSGHAKKTILRYL